jgi:two-component system, sensor histidine kinase
MPTMSDKERFLSTAVHDLKNPLHSIVLFIAALKQSIDEPERIQYLIDRLDRSTRGLDALFKRLLDISRLDLGKTIPVVSVFDLGTLFETLEGQFAPFAERKDLRFSTHLEEPVWVRADPVMTTEILINLLSNAFRYTKEGAISLRSQRGDTGVMIEVCDTGEGISPETVQFIFDEFAQVSNGRHIGSKKGLGLGLAIVQRLARAMGTEVSVQSQIGRGSVFRFRLPVSLEAPRKALDVTARQALRGLLVLVVDDDVHALTAMEALLVASGCFVMLARNLSEAEVKLEANERFPDLVISESIFNEGPDCAQLMLRLEEIMGTAPPLLIVTRESNHSGTRPSVQARSGTQKVVVITKPAGSEEILESLCQLIGSAAPNQTESLI